MSSIPPPPPVPPTRPNSFTAPAPAPAAPTVPSDDPTGAILVELLILHGPPLKDHWAWWIPSHTNPNLGVQVHATGEVRDVSRFEVKRSYDFDVDGDCPTKRVPLQWVDAKHFNE